MFSPGSPFSDLPLGDGDCLHVICVLGTGVCLHVFMTGRWLLTEEHIVRDMVCCATFQLRPQIRSRIFRAIFWPLMYVCLMEGERERKRERGRERERGRQRVRERERERGKDGETERGRARARRTDQMDRSPRGGGRAHPAAAAAAGTGSVRRIVVSCCLLLR